MQEPKSIGLQALSDSGGGEAQRVLELGFGLRSDSISAECVNAAGTNHLTLRAELGVEHSCHGQQVHESLWAILPQFPLLGTGESFCKHVRGATCSPSMV